MKKNLLLLISFLIVAGYGKAQQLYDNFDGKSVGKYTEINGVLDIRAKNPAPNEVDNSKYCAKYTRPSGIPYASIKFDMKAKPTDVAAYATYLGIPPKVKLKVYTKAPVGTRIEVQFGKKGQTYPSGIHSIYQGKTTVQNAWEEITFNFSYTPKESQVSPEDINQVVIMFAPNSANSDVYYFDDLMGPQLEGSETTAASTSTENK